jgi:outer membrane protein OmpA-like peptidoglycan-associated protein
MISYAKLILPGTAITACLALAACVAVPTDNSLEQARIAVHSAELDPAVARFDAIDLAAAQKHLALAEDAEHQGARDLVDHEAYLATRVARLSQVRADEGLAQERVAAAGGDRARAEVYAANQQSAVANETVRELQAQIAGLTLQSTPHGAMLILTDDYFDTDRAQLRPGAGQILDGVAQFLIAHPERRVRVEGHADSGAISASDMALSLHRAEAVRMALIARGVDPMRSEALAYGPANPLAGNDVAGDRHFIRGVEILLSDSRGEIASR